MINRLRNEAPAIVEKEGPLSMDFDENNWHGMDRYRKMKIQDYKRNMCIGCQPTAEKARTTFNEE